MRTLAVLLISALLSACAHADGSGDRPDTRVQLDARAETEVDNDRLRATLFAEVEDDTGAAASQRVNRAAADAVAALKGIAGLDVHTGGYQSYPVSDKGRIVGWRARAELVLEGADFARVAEAIGQALPRMQLARVEFFVSDARRAAVEAELTEAAIAEFLAKARRVARAFGGRDFHVVEASVGSDGAAPPRPMMATRAMAEDSAPVFEGGSSRLGVTVSGAVQVLR